MLPTEWCFGLFFVAAVIVGFWQARKHGLPHGLGAAMAIALASASWFEITIWEVPLGVPTAVSVVMLSLLTICKPRVLLSPWGSIDLLLGAVFVWHCIVDVSQGSSLVSTAALAYGEWVLPYAAGRYAMIQSSSLQRLAPWFCSVACVLAMGAVVESFTSFNLWRVLLHEVDDSVLRPTDKRYDLLYRSISNVRNPIFLGILLLTLLPWAASLRSRNSDDQSFSNWSRFMIGLLLAGILSTVSRGPIIAATIAAVLVGAISNRAFRNVALVASIVLSVLIYAKFDAVVSMLDKGVNERGSIMQLDDKAEVYDGTRHRLLILKLYAPLIVDGGVLGYGTVATTGFPPKIPGLPRDERARTRLGVVDNSYLLIGLRLGYVGLLLFMGMLAASIFSMAVIRFTSSHNDRIHEAIACFCSSIAIAFAIGFVYWDYDYGFWVLFYFGVTAGFVSQRKIERKFGMR